ncbi:hypothetical protein [Aliarcobacter butzleri]|uniref:hypothetical protein n=1 Tax=Aliarcobacter butzleri TaxID=28197 RepID=UPI0021B523E2|nr:hypothetical protein [Aliarcobacter butzleri]MCT7637030.1 hypothetical protein [Aliarcobacter butzleri]
MKPNYEDFKQWAKGKLKEWLSSDYVNNLDLRICTFTDGEPYIGGYPHLSYSIFLYEYKIEKKSLKKRNEVSKNEN